MIGIGVFIADWVERKSQKAPKNINLYSNIFQKLFTDLLFISGAFSIFDFQNEIIKIKIELNAVLSVLIYFL